MTINTTSALITDFPTQRVQRWNPDTMAWVPEPDVYCDELVRRTNAYSTAVLRYELGEVFQTGGTAFLNYIPIDLPGKFIRILVDQPDGLDQVVWMGYVTGTATDRDGVKNVAGTNKLQGSTQYLSAVGWEYFLNRDQINSAVIFDKIRIERALVFNGGASGDRDSNSTERGNMQPDFNSEGQIVFADGSDGFETALLADVIDHLLFYHGPRDKDGTKRPTSFELQDVGIDIASMVCPRLPTERKTVFQLLNELLSPARGFCWWVEPDPDFPFSTPAKVRIATLGDDDITLPNGSTLPKNPDQQTADFDTQLDVDTGNMKQDLSRRYHQVIVRGERMTSTFTVGFVDYDGENEYTRSLAKDWTDAAETEYKQAAAVVMDAGAYAALSPDQKQKENDALRRDERHYRVYSAMRIPPTWDGKSGDGAGGTRNWAIPVLSSTGSVLSGKPLAVRYLRLHTHTRLIRGANYHDLTNLHDPTPAGSDPEFKPTFGLIKVATSPDRYQYIEKLANAKFANSTPVSDKIDGGFHVHIEQNSPGILIKPNGGLSHRAALNHWTSSEPTGVEPQVDYATLRVTVTAEVDAYCEGKYPADADLPADVPLERLTIDAGNDFRLDWLAANTVVGLNDGVPILAIGGPIRDDSKMLGTVARLAHQWYGTERTPLTVQFKNVRNVFRLGMLLTTIGSGSTAVDVNTVVSAITFNFRQSAEHPTATMSIETQKDDIDFAALIG